jgi:thiol-disulfide isomerase/thioredoxin
MSEKILKNIPYLEPQDINPSDGSLNPDVCNNKPVVLMVQGNFCGWCTKAKPEVQKLADSGAVTVCTVQSDGDANDQAANRNLGVVNKSQGVPAFLLYNRMGKFVKMHEGERTAAALKAACANL